jgi:hypothetical protein
LIYSVRFSSTIQLPDLIKSNISKLRTIPAAYKYARTPRVRHIKREDVGNWREKVLVDYIRKMRETDDPDYDEIFMILNKIAPATFDILSKQSIEIMKKRDEQFRLRVTTLLFDKAIRGSAYANIMADLAQKMNIEIVEVSEDLETHVNMFTTLYDMTETFTFPLVEDPEFNEKVISWAKQKDIRRGYARFLTHLFSRQLITGRALQESMQQVIQDLNETAILAKTSQTEENVTQFADFLFEIAKLLKPTAVELRGLILTKVNDFLARPRSDLPSLNMRSRFKLEDTVKCVKVC